MDSAPVQVEEARELVDLDCRAKSREVDGVDGLLDQGQVVPDEAGHQNVLLVVAPQDALAIIRKLSAVSFLTHLSDILLLCSICIYFHLGDLEACMSDCVPHDRHDLSWELPFFFSALAQKAVSHLRISKNLD